MQTARLQAQIKSKDSLPRSKSIKTASSLPAETPARTSLLNTTAQKNVGTPAKSVLAKPKESSSLDTTPKTFASNVAQPLPLPPVKPKATFTRPAMDASTAPNVSRSDSTQPEFARSVQKLSEDGSIPSITGATISSEAQKISQRKEKSVFKAPRVVEKQSDQIEKRTNESGKTLA